MGLDMYYYRRLHDAPAFDSEVKTIDGRPIPKSNNDMYSRTVKEIVGYQRKANAVHGWIVRELADGVDECQEIPLDRHSLVALLDEINVALLTGEGMDPTPGFLFGGQEKDEHWRENLILARDIATWILDDMKEPKPEGVFVEWSYLASW